MQFQYVPYRDAYGGIIFRQQDGFRASQFWRVIGRDGRRVYFQGHARQVNMEGCALIDLAIDLDPAFIPYILTHNLTGSIINGTNPDRIRDILQGSMVTGTFFGTMI